MTGNPNFWAILDVEGVTFDVEEEGVIIDPEKELEAQKLKEIKAYGRKIDYSRYARRVELENRKEQIETITKLREIRGMLKKLEEVIATPKVQIDDTTAILFYLDNYNSINVLLDNYDNIKALFEKYKAITTEEVQKSITKAQKFLSLIRKSNKPKKAKRKPRKTNKTMKNTIIAVKLSRTARYRVYIPRGTRVYVAYVKALDVSELERIQAEIFKQARKTEISGLYILPGGIPAVQFRREEIDILREQKKFLSLPETIRKLRAIQKERIARRQKREQWATTGLRQFLRRMWLAEPYGDTEAFIRAIVGFRRLFAQ